MSTQKNIEKTYCLWQDGPNQPPPREGARVQLFPDSELDMDSSMDMEMIQDEAVSSPESSLNMDETFPYEDFSDAEDQEPDKEKRKKIHLYIV